MLSIRDLHVTVDDNKSILNGVNLDLEAGKINVIMGKNGSGKSTLLNVIAGKPGYEVKSGTIIYKEKNILDLEPDERANLGIFMAFQYPVEIPGVSLLKFMQTSLNCRNKYHQKPAMATASLLKSIKLAANDVGLSEEMIYRAVNVGFSGGEKKRIELMQMMLLQPDCMLLDETDSGLDIDALKIVANGFNGLMNKDKIALIVTHYQRLLDYIKPDIVHIMHAGKVVCTGDSSLVLDLEKHGYAMVE